MSVVHPSEGGCGDRLVSDDVLAVWAERMERRRPLAVERTATQHRSLDFRDVIASLATRGAMRADQLEAAAIGGTPITEVDARWMYAMACVLAQQELKETDLECAQALFEVAQAIEPLRRAGRRRLRRYGEVLVDRRDVGGIARFAAGAAEVPGYFSGYVLADAANPTVNGASDFARWHERWNAVFRHHAVDAPEIADLPGPLFDRLIGRPRRAVTAGPLVSVVVTAFRPNQALVVSVRSLLRQTWQNFEIIVVDDGSPESYSDVFSTVGDLDERVHILRLEENQGTYRARNAGVARASGAIVTGQDSDDWAHPERLERQVEALTTGGRVVASLCHSLTVTEDLVFSRRGFWPERVCEASLMFWRDDWLRLGGYVDARKSADTEFLERLALVGTRKTVAAPLMLVRVLENSLSRSDFAGSRHHEDRIFFRSAWRATHREMARSPEKSLSSDQVSSSVPDRFRVSKPQRGGLDLLLVGDWRHSGPVERMWLDLARQAAGRGERVGALLLENPWWASETLGEISYEATSAVREGLLRWVATDDQVVSRLAVMIDPRALVFLPVRSLSARADRTLVYCSATPMAYGPEQIARAATTLLGGPAALVASSAAVEASLRDRLEDGVGLIEPWRLAPHVQAPSMRNASGRHQQGILLDELAELSDIEVPGPFREAIVFAENRRLSDLRLFDHRMVVLDPSQCSLREFCGMVDNVLVADLPGTIEFELRRAAVTAYGAETVAAVEATLPSSRGHGSGLRPDGQPVDARSGLRAEAPTLDELYGCVRTNDLGTTAVSGPARG